MNNARRYAPADPEKVEALIASIARRRGAGRPQLEDEIRQEARIRVWRGMHSFDKDSGLSPEAFAAVLADRAAIQFMREELKHSCAALQASDLPELAASPEDLGLVLDLDERVKRLPALRDRIIARGTAQGFSSEQLASLLGERAGNVRKARGRIWAALREAA